MLMGKMALAWPMRPNLLNTRALLSRGILPPFCNGRAHDPAPLPPFSSGTSSAPTAAPLYLHSEANVDTAHNLHNDPRRPVRDDCPMGRKKTLSSSCFDDHARGCLPSLAKTTLKQEVDRGRKEQWKVKMRGNLWGEMTDGMEMG